jgi:hypothetical protein
VRKRIINFAAERIGGQRSGLDLERLAEVEVTSESAEHPIECALVPSAGPGWRAGEPGAQTIRVIFNHSLRLRRIRLKFDEHEQARTQEFVLRWLPRGENTFREIVRQQYTFSPAGAKQEVEDYRVDLNEVSALELEIIPNISGGEAYASLAEMSLSEAA